MTYLYKKRNEVLESIKPICEVFNITDYDYEISPKETLRIYDTIIDCSGTSVRYIIDELIAWIFVRTFCKRSGLGAFEKQTLNYITKNWRHEKPQNTKLSSLASEDIAIILRNIRQEEQE